MTINKTRVGVLLDLLRRELPAMAEDRTLRQISTTYLMPEFTSEHYDRMPEESIQLWNNYRKIDAIKFMRPLFLDLDLGQCKRLLETHPRTLS